MQEETPDERNLVSNDGDLYATPFYGSSSFMFYRKDLFEAAGLTMPEQPTWEEVAGFAAKLDDDANNISGICLRGIPGWGQSLAPLTTVINTYGGRWFDGARSGDRSGATRSARDRRGASGSAKPARSR